MNKHFFQASAFTLLTILFFITSCKGQLKTELAKDNSGKEMSVFNKKSKIPKPQGMNNEAVIGFGIQDRVGNLWFGSNGEGVYRYDGKLFVPFTMNEGLNSNTIYSIIEDKIGNIWVGTNKGLNRFDGEKFESIPIVLDPKFSTFPNNVVSNSPPIENAVWSMMQDKNGTIWLGTDYGVYCYNDLRFTRFLDNQNLINKDGLQLKAIFSIIESKNGNIWFAACVSEGVSVFDGKTLSNIIPYKNVGRTDRIIEDTKGNLWFACVFKGMGRFDGKIFSQNVFNEKPVNGPSNIIEDANGNIWFDTQDGLGRYDGKELKIFTEKDGAPSQNLIPVLLDRAGHLWFSSKYMGLYQYSDGKFISFSE